MNTSTPRFYPAHEAVPVVLGPLDDLPSIVGAHGLAPDEMIAIFVDGDWQVDAAGPVDMESMFGELAAQAPDGKIICAIVIRGNLHAPKAILVDRDTDWAPALTVGGHVRARGLCLGGGATRIVGDLHLDGTLYGKYNHGSLDVGGITTANVILSSDFAMNFHGKVRCAHVLSANGVLNIAAHFEDATLEKILQPDFLDADDNLIDDLVMEALFDNRSLLVSAGKIGKKPPRTVSKAGRAYLAALEAAAARGPVRRIDFERCDLKFVPDALAQHAAVTSLSLEGNRVGALPAWMAELQQLEELNIADCALSAVPDWVARLPRLRTLKVHGNDLTDFPNVAGGFAALEELKIGNTYTDSAAHRQLVCELPLAQFPRLRSFSNQLNVTFACPVEQDDRYWESQTLEHLDITPALKGTMPACLLRMPQLRSLDLQLGAGITASAMAVFARLGHLEALQLSYGKQDAAFNAALAATLPGTLIRCNNTSAAPSAIKEAKRSISGLMYERAWAPALAAANEQVARVEAAWPALSASDHEQAFKQKHEILRGIALDTPPGSLKHEQISAAAQYAGAILARYEGVSASTMWTLSFSLGELRSECLLTQAWCLLRRDEPDMARATHLLDQLDSEITAYSPFRHVSSPLQQQIKQLRGLCS